MFKRRRFPVEIILICVRWYCKYGITYRDLAEMMQERGVEVDAPIIFRWVQVLCNHRGRPWRYQASPPAYPWLSNDEDGLRHDQGLRSPNRYKRDCRSMIRMYPLLISYPERKNYDDPKLN
jgi:hypothetical protein